MLTAAEKMLLAVCHILCILLRLGFFNFSSNPLIFDVQNESVNNSSFVLSIKQLIMVSDM